MFHRAHTGPSVMNTAFSNYELVITDIEDTCSIIFLACGNDGHIKNLLRISVWWISQDNAEMKFSWIVVSAGNQNRRTSPNTFFDH